MKLKYKSIGENGSFIETLEIILEYVKYSKILCLLENSTCYLPPLE